MSAINVHYQHRITRARIWKFCKELAHQLLHAIGVELHVVLDDYVMSRADSTVLRSAGMRLQVKVPLDVAGKDSIDHGAYFRITRLAISRLLIGRIKAQMAAPADGHCSNLWKRTTTIDMHNSFPDGSNLIEDDSGSFFRHAVAVDEYIRRIRVVCISPTVQALGHHFLDIDDDLVRLVLSANTRRPLGTVHILASNDTDNASRCMSLAFWERVRHFNADNHR